MAAEMRIDKVRDQLRDASSAATAYAQSCKELREQRDELLAALQQATDQLEADYVATPLDGSRALIDKLRAVIAKATK